MKIIQSICLLSLCISASASADSCTHNGKEYGLFESISFLDPVYGTLPEHSNHSKDGYTLVLRCMPVVDVLEVEDGNFSVVNIPARSAQWTVSEVIYAFDHPEVFYTP